VQIYVIEWDMDDRDPDDDGVEGDERIGDSESVESDTKICE
jgi:hypothetical protein